MKKILFSILILLLFENVAEAQLSVEAGPDQINVCGSSVVLQAYPFYGWSKLQTPTIASITLYSVKFLTANVGFVGGNVGAIYKTEDKGRSWSIVTTLGSAGNIYAIYFVDSDLGFAVGSGGKILRTNNGGNTWTIISTDGTTNFRSVYFLNNRVGFAVGNYGAIFKTIDAGLTWVKSVYNSSHSYYSIIFLSELSGYISGSNGVLLKTIDGGVNWTQQNVVSNNATLYSSDFISPETGYICGSSGTILKTTNHGESWVKYDHDSVFTIESPTLGGKLIKSVNFNSIHFVSADTGYVSGSFGSGSLFAKTTDGGLHWYEIKNNLKTKVNSMDIVGEPNVGYAVTTQGGIARYNDQPSLLGFSNFTWYSNYESFMPTENGTTLVSPENTTVYTVSAFNQYGEPTTDSMTVFVKDLSITSAPKNVIFDGSQIVLDNYKTNYSGPDKFKYKWTPSTGLSSDTAQFPIVTLNSSFAEYNLTITTPKGCAASCKVVLRDSLVVKATVDKTVNCSGTVQLNAISNFNGSGRVSYKWTPTTGLSNDTIANPTAVVNSDITYKVTIFTETGKTTSDTVQVKVYPLTANAGIDWSIRCGSSVSLQAKTNYDQNKPLRYKWTPSVFLNNDTIFNPIVSPNTTMTYQLTVTSEEGCVATDECTVTVLPFTVNAGADKAVVCGSGIQLDSVVTTLTSASKFKYKWTPSSGLSNDTVPDPVANPNETTTYTVEVSTASGCVFSDNVMVTVLPLQKPAINYVLVNEANKNVLNWSMPPTGAVDSFVIYKETNVSDMYLKIGVTKSTESLSYTDTLSNPEVQSNRYKISSIDICGNESQLSSSHKTMHLSINKGINNIWNLIWEPYEGFSVSTYNIYRGINPDNVQIIGSLSGSNTQFSDYTAPVGFIYYQIEAVSSNKNNIKTLKVKSENQVFFSSRSNIASNKREIIASLNENLDSDIIELFPNPASDEVTMKINATIIEKFHLKIYNAIGQLIKYIDIESEFQKVDISELNKGVYFFELSNENQTGMCRLVVK